MPVGLVQRHRQHLSNDRRPLPQTAHVLGISLDEALLLIEQRKLPAARGDDGGAYIRREDVDTYRPDRRRLTALRNGHKPPCADLAQPRNCRPWGWSAESS